MNQQQRNTRTMIQGVVNNVFDICEANGVMPEREDFCYAINFWMEHALLVKCLPGIDNKRLPVPEINISQQEIDTIMNIDANDLDCIWAYDEPHPSGGNAHITMTKKQAIQYMRIILREKELHPNLQKDTEKIFDEWVTLHWAYKINEKESK